MKNRNIKSIIFGFIIISLLCIGCKPKYTGEDYEAIHTCEAVEDITQEEIVSFENMLIFCGFSQSMTENYELVGYCYPRLCVFNDGSVYCMKDSREVDSTNLLFETVDEAAWETMEEVYYLGCLSGEDLCDLFYYTSSIDANSEYYQRSYLVEPGTSGLGVGIENENWNGCGSAIIQQNEFGVYEWIYMQSISRDGERIRVNYQILDRNAIKAMDILTESWFYEKWLELIFEEAE